MWDVPTDLEVVVLPLLLRLEPQARQPAEVLLAHRFVDGCASPDALAVVVRNVRPPVRLLRNGIKIYTGVYICVLRNVTKEIFSRNENKATKKRYCYKKQKTVHKRIQST